MQDVLQAFGANLIVLSSDSPEADIEPLAKQGVPAFGLMQDGRIYFNYHHTAADTLDKIVPRELQENATALAVMGMRWRRCLTPCPDRPAEPANRGISSLRLPEPGPARIARRILWAS